MHRIYLGLCYKRAEVAPLAGGTSFEMKQANKTNMSRCGVQIDVAMGGLFILTGLLPRSS
jgi:hypothetical protein